MVLFVLIENNLVQAMDKCAHGNMVGLKNIVLTKNKETE